MKLEKIILFLIILYLIYQILCKNNIIEGFKWIKREDCKYKTNKTVLHVLKKYGIGKGDLTNWDMYLPCTYNNVDLELRSIPPAELGKNLFIINNCDAITSKNNLWKILVDKHGLMQTLKMMPETYILKNFDMCRYKNKYKADIKVDNCPYKFSDFFDNYVESKRAIGDLDRFIQGHKQGKLYILKKNIQRQKGLKITNKFNDVIFGKQNGYVIAQDLLQNPYLINGRKINLRVYLLIVCKNDKIEAYAHKNGFIYYTAEKFKKNCIEMGPNVTTGYIDRQVYVDNPLTLEDFRLYLDNQHRKMGLEEVKLIYDNERKLSKILFDKIYLILNKVIEAAVGHICGTKNVPTHISEQTSFQLFGVDFSVSDKLEPHIMEINKGPDLGAKDKRDKHVKIGVATDILTTLGLTNETMNNFIKIY